MDKRIADWFKSLAERLCRTGKACAGGRRFDKKTAAMTAAAGGGGNCVWALAEPRNSGRGSVIR